MKQMKLTKKGVWALGVGLVFLTLGALTVLSSSPFIWTVILCVIALFFFVGAYAARKKA